MKKLILLSLICCVFNISNAQIVIIPDANFKTKLVLSNAFQNAIAKNLQGNFFNVDANGNGEIEMSEALNVGYLNLDNASISTLIGIEAFTNLKELYCNNNQINTLDATQLTSLTRLQCFYNQMTSINVSGMINLKTLECGANQIPSLDVSTLSGLIGLSCGQNLLTNLDASGLNTLGFLSCSDNLLTSINLTGLHNLITLNCSFNQLTSIDLFDLNLLESLTCNNNLLSNLDASNLRWASIICNNNQIVNLLIKNGGSEPTLDFSNNPTIRYICADEFQLQSIENYIASYGYGTSCTVNSYCSFVPGGTFYTINGYTKWDTNNNGCDVDDFNFSNLKFNITNGSNSSTFIADQTGSFSIPVQNGSHTITPILENPNYYTISPSSAFVNFPSAASPFNKTFCVTDDGIHYDMEITIVPLEIARPGFFTTYSIIYKNKATVTQSGTINLTFNNAVLDLFSTNPIANSQQANSLSWNFENLQPNDFRKIHLKFYANSPQDSPPLNAGNVLTFNANISTAVVDEVPSDNTFILKQTVVNSFDPNDKTCLQGNAIATAKVGDYVHYRIRFENTGTFAAQNIVVKDIIDTNKFEMASLLPVDGSHNFTTRIINTNRVEFIFQDINLPFEDDLNDGYVIFKIKTKSTLVSGNTFTNSANIYFDYNFPIVTNTTSTIVSNVLGIQDLEFSNYFSYYPNPAKNVLNIKFKQNDVLISSLSIYNLLGQLVQTIVNPEKAIDISNLKSSNYIIKTVSNKGTFNSKLTIE